ncbi:MAG: phosphate ABC transporter permease PstA [Trueperaceae bacterium]|nr:phosphate ABC transporter permease PstA [Trueperaceae bacterium]
MSAAPQVPEARGGWTVGEEAKRDRARRRSVGRAFAATTAVPVALAVLFLLALLGGIFTDLFSWQVVASNNSAESFAWREAPVGGDAVVRLELAAQGLDEAAIEATLNYPEQRRRFFARNRVEFMLYTDQGPFRWVVTNMRNRSIELVDLIPGFGQRAELEAALEPGQRLLLNPWLDGGFFQRVASRNAVSAGLKTALVGTLIVILGVVLFAIPIGVGTAVYLEEYVAKTRLARVLEVNIANLAGVPSIVYGILGLSVFVRLLNFGPSVLAAIFTLTLLALPVVVIAGREAIKSVPSSLRQASYGLGATRWQTVWRVVLPSAAPGIATGVVLSVARAIGETAPLLLVGAAAFVPNLPSTLSSPYTVIPVQIYSWISENSAEFRHVAAAGIATLISVVGALYAVVFVIRRRLERTRA